MKAGIAGGLSRQCNTLITLIAEDEEEKKILQELERKHPKDVNIIETSPRFVALLPELNR